MKKIVCVYGVFVLLFFNVVFVHANTEKIPMNDTYVSGVITALSNEKTSGEENEVKRYSFQLEQPGKIDLHFISHINNMHIQIKDSDENIIEDDYITKEDSPKDYPLTLDQGTYTLHIIKIAPLGLFGAQVSEDNVGEYKFKMKYSPVLTEENENIKEIDSIALGKKYKGFFESKNDNDIAEQECQLQISKNGKYKFNLSSDMNVDYVIKDKDENVIGEGESGPDDESTEEYELSKGTYDVVFSSEDAGSHQVIVSADEVKENNEENEGEESEENKKETKSEKSFFKTLLSPSTFIGALIVTVVGGVIILIIEKFIK